MKTLELKSLGPRVRDVLQSDPDNLRADSEQALRRARELLVAANVSPMDADYRMVVLDQGTAIFNREIGAPIEERVGFYRQALEHYKEAATVFVDDPRPLLYQGLCYERLVVVQRPAGNRSEEFALGEAALRKAASMEGNAPDYTPALPLRALALLYSHVGDYHAALDSLQRAKMADPTNPATAEIDNDIRTVQQALGTH